MLITLPRVSPISAVYEANKQQFDAAIDFMIDSAAEKTGSKVIGKMFRLAHSSEKALKAA